MKKINSKILLALIITSTLLTAPVNVLAVSAQSAAATAQANQQTKIDSLKTRGAQEIDRRLTALNLLIGKVDSIKRLSDSQKSDFKNQIQANITDLTGLKTKINADTDLVTLKTDVKSIVTSYRIFALFMPKINLLSATNVADQIATNLSTLAGKLDTRISQEESNGQDVASLKTTLADMQAKINSAQTTITSVDSSVIALTPDGYPGNKTALQSARSSVTTIKQDLTAAKQDATKIIQGLKALGASANSSTTNQ